MKRLHNMLSLLLKLWKWSYFSQYVSAGVMYDRRRFGWLDGGHAAQNLKAQASLNSKNAHQVFSLDIRPQLIRFEPTEASYKHCDFNNLKKLTASYTVRHESNRLVWHTWIELDAQIVTSVTYVGWLDDVGECRYRKLKPSVMQEVVNRGLNMWGFWSSLVFVGKVIVLHWSLE